MDSQIETPITPLDQPKKSRTGLIIGLVILVVLCCCCGFVVFIYYMYNYWGDQIINEIIPQTSSLFDFFLVWDK